MPVLTITETMLYCPKCQQTYEDGSQRFCSKEGERLVHSSTNKSRAGSNGALSNGLTKNPFGEISSKAKSFASKGSKKNPKKSIFPGFSPPAESKIFKNETHTTVSPDNPVSIEKPLLKSIKPDEITFKQARLGDRKTNPTEDRSAITHENPEVLLNQTVKGRYFISKKLGQDENGIAFLAEDRIFAGRKVLLNVLMDEDPDDDYESKIIAEERVSLAHINHPNIASVIDSGELPEGEPFIVTEFIDGKSVKDILIEEGQFDAARAARIIRRVSHALSEAHESGILHRNLIPENIILTVGENGAELVKLTNFGISKGELNKANIHYKSPEQIERKPATFTADNFSLAVITYQMLTNRLPFRGLTKKEFLNAQRDGLTLRPTDLRFDLPASVDEVLIKALSFNPTERFTTAREFGDAFFESVGVASKQSGGNEPKDTRENFEAKTISEIGQTISEDKAILVKGLNEKKHSPQSLEAGGKISNTLTFLGAVILLSGLFGIWFYFINQTNEPVRSPVGSSTPPEQSLKNSTRNEIAVQIPLSTAKTEAPPVPRSIPKPSNSVFFENGKQDLNDLLLQNYLGFSLYYPETWTRNETDNKFLDVSKKSPNGLPIEQMLVSYYESKGTFDSDREAFPKLVENSNQDLKKIVPNYQTLYEGETKINGGWKAYEVKFQGGGATKKGEEKLILWGRRIWIPAARPGAASGFVITLLATSLSPDVTSVDDVGVKGELAKILATFEPSPSF